MAYRTRLRARLAAAALGMVGTLVASSALAQLLLPPSDPPRVIRFLASDDFFPFVYRDFDGTLVGYNVELARAVCGVLEASCSLRIVPFESLASDLERDEGNVVLGELALTAERLGDLAFSQIYFPFPARFVGRVDGAADFEAFRAGTPIVAVVAGTWHEAFLEQFFVQARRLAVPDAVIARAALVEGRVEAVFDDAMSLSFWLAGDSTHGCCRFLGGPWLEPGFFDRGLAFAVRADNVDIVDALDYALQQLRDEGTLDELYARYFPLDFYR